MLDFWPCCAFVTTATIILVKPQFMYVTMHDRLYSTCQKDKTVINQWHAIYGDAERLL